MSKKQHAISPAREASRAVGEKMRDLRKARTVSRSAEGLSRRPIYSRGTLWHDEADAQLRRIPALEAERDQLRAEVQRWSLLAARFEAERNLLREEVEALRADAERYRWLRMQHEGDKAVSFSVFCPGKIYSLEPAGSMPGELDETIDAARKQQ